MNEELKPCPFCGEQLIADNQPIVVEWHNWRVECPLCDCGCAWNDSKEEAIEQWNRRLGKNNKTMKVRK